MLGSAGSDLAGNTDQNSSYVDGYSSVRLSWPALHMINSGVECGVWANMKLSSRVSRIC